MIPGARQLTPQVDVAGASAMLDRLGSPLPNVQAVDQSVYWDCPAHACAQVVKDFRISPLPLGQVVHALREWAAGAGLQGGDDAVIQCSGSSVVPASFAPVGDCYAGWILPDGTGEVDVHLRLSVPVPRPHYDDAHGVFIGGGPWTDYAAATVSQAWIVRSIQRPGED